MTLRCFWLATAVSVAIGLPSLAGEEPPTALGPGVAKFLDLDRRDEAFKSVIERQVYRGEGTYTEKNAKPVRHVVACPQPKGPPLFAVFPKSRERQPEAMHRPAGHFVLVDTTARSSGFTRRPTH